MISKLSPRNLTWEEVDPARHPFDGESAAQVVRSLRPAGRVPRRPDVPPGDRALHEWSWDEARPWSDAMTYALAEHYGPWVAGWRWAHDEGDFDGGPVGSWCCPQHSVTTPAETLDRVTAALREWRAWLESLATRFEAYPLDLADIDDQRILWDRTAHNLILHVTDRTGCGSAWYGHCHQVLSWFLTRWGVAADDAEFLVDRAIGGRFKSWTGPDPVLVEDIAERLAASVRPHADARAAESPLPDHLERWLAVREAVPWQEAQNSTGDGPVTPSRDGAAEEIRTFDAILDPARGQGLLAALELMRADAARGARLDFDLIQGWQRHVLGTPGPPPLRTLAAFAKGGRERYGIGPDTQARLDACLAESAKDTARPLPLTARAARAFLDVCFFHPFDDGNGRSALLTLLFVLAREGVALDCVRLLRRVSFQADEPQDALTLARYVDLHLRETRRRTTDPAA
ncbi:Fic family protein [Streptomyces monashensis]|uniref:Cell filamentation protein Fic n=1 Tax=Streptomyces monashensis TaxID=1678012 RepID=A0A1S2PF34_9ACTN|nr:Fic family protein [Streptomyces monashensis]OIJ92267.1 cell filamentation protein Fic [Streptomyces monashensis]